MFLYSSYVDNKDIEYSSTLSYSVQEDIFYGIKKVGNYISTNIINNETKYYTKEATKNLFSAGKTVITNIISSFKADSSIDKEKSMPTNEL